jgi:hypothetical protein
MSALRTSPHRDSQRKLARDVREHARAEREHRLRAGVVEYAEFACRSALYEKIASILDDTDRPVSSDALALVRNLLGAPLTAHDYGATARARDERIASIVAELERSASAGAPHDAPDVARPVRHPLQAARGEIASLVDVAERGESAATPAVVIAGVGVVLAPIVATIIVFAFAVGYFATKASPAHRTTHARAQVGSSPLTTARHCGEPSRSFRRSRPCPAPVRPIGGLPLRRATATVGEIESGGSHGNVLGDRHICGPDRTVRGSVRAPRAFVARGTSTPAGVTAIVHDA